MAAGTATLVVLLVGILGWPGAAIQCWSVTGESMKAVMWVLLREGELVLSGKILLWVDICMSKSLVMLPLSRIV